MWRSRKTDLRLYHSHRPASALLLGIGSFLNESFALRRELLLLLSTYVILSFINQAISHGQAQQSSQSDKTSKDAIRPSYHKNGRESEGQRPFHKSFKKSELNQPRVAELQGFLLLSRVSYLNGSLLFLIIDSRGKRTPPSPSVDQISQRTSFSSKTRDLRNWWEIQKSENPTLRTLLKEESRSCTLSHE